MLIQNIMSLLKTIYIQLNSTKLKTDIINIPQTENIYCIRSLS